MDQKVLSSCFYHNASDTVDFPGQILNKPAQSAEQCLQQSRIQQQWLASAVVSFCKNGSCRACSRTQMVGILHCTKPVGRDAERGQHPRECSTHGKHPHPIQFHDSFSPCVPCMGQNHPSYHTQRPAWVCAAAPDRKSPPQQHRSPYLGRYARSTATGFLLNNSFGYALWASAGIVPKNNQQWYPHLLHPQLTNNGCCRAEAHLGEVRHRVSFQPRYMSLPAEMCPFQPLHNGRNSAVHFATSCFAVAQKSGCLW